LTNDPRERNLRGHCAGFLRDGIDGVSTWSVPRRLSERAIDSRRSAGLPSTPRVAGGVPDRA